MRPTFLRVELAWLALCVCAWLLLSSLGAREEAKCRARDDFLCFSTGEVFYLVGLAALAAFILGSIAFALVWAAVALARRLAGPSSG